MGKHLWFRNALLAAILCAFGMSEAVLAIDEVEPNHPISSAQPLPISGGVVATIGGSAAATGGATVNSVIGNLTGPAVLDVDFYSFEVGGQDASTVTIDINGGMGGVRAVDTILTLFGPAPNYALLTQNDDCTVNGYDFDACIVNYLLPPGTYTVAVSSYPCYLMAGGLYTTGCREPRPDAPGVNGDYTLVVSGVTLSVQVLPISIEIKPGSGVERAPVNPKSRGKIPVALLSSDGFNALDVDVASLTFGATGDEQSLSRCGKGGQDVNGDGVPDLVCHFENQLARFTPEAYEGIVRGTTTDGRQFEGRGLLKVVPVKRQN
jgi:hypothetical protein